MENSNALRRREQRIKTEQPIERAGDRAKEAASGMMDKTKEAASNVAQSASEFASDAGKKAEEAATAVGGGLKSLAQALREKAPRGGALGVASSSVADSLERGGRYIEESGFSGIGAGLTSLVRNNPLPAFFIGMGLGFLIARATKS